MNGTKNKYIFIALPITIGLIFSMIKMFDVPKDMINQYLVLILSLIGYIFVILFVNYYIKIDLLDSFVFFTSLYIIIYCIAPMNSLIQNDTSHKTGVYVFDACIEGTVIAFISYFAYIIGYMMKINLNFKKSEKTKNLMLYRRQVFFVSLIIWGIGMFFTLLYLIMRGQSIVYIFTLGMGGTVNTELVENSTLAFFSVIANVMYASWLCIFIYGESKLLKFLTFYFTLSSLFVRGFRIYIVILVVAPLLWYYMKNKKRPKIFIIALLIILMVVMIGFIGFARRDVRTGNEVDIKNFSVKAITDAIYGNFDIYKTYYAVIKAIPEKYNYTYGQQIFLYSIVMMIPRALWASKPVPVVHTIIRVSLSDYAATAGAAYPGLGEYYHEFGILGCIFFMFVMGCFCKYLWQLVTIRKSNNIIAYSLIYPILLQFIIRGYTPSNIWLLLSSLVPVFFIQHFYGSIDLDELGSKDAK